MALREFGLEINDTKTEVFRSSGLRDDSWPRTISRRLEVYKKLESDIFALFEEAFDISERIKNEAPIRYLLRRSDKQKIFEDDHWKVTENFLIKCLYNYPHSTDYIARIIVRRSAMFDDLDKKKWERVIGNRLLNNIQMGHDHEICWLLWTAISLKLPITDEVAKKIIAYQNPLVALMGAHALSCGLINAALDVTAWESHVSTEQLNEEWWMFAYECSLRGWFKTNLKNAEMKDTIFLALKDAKVSFYDETIPSDDENYFASGVAIPALGFGYEDGEEEEEEEEENDVGY